MVYFVQKYTFYTNNSKILYKKTVSFAKNNKFAEGY